MQYVENRQNRRGVSLTCYFFLCNMLRSLTSFFLCNMLKIDNIGGVCVGGGGGAGAGGGPIRKSACIMHGVTG